MLTTTHKAVLDVIDDWCGTGRHHRWPPHSGGGTPHLESRIALTAEPNPDPWRTGQVISLLRGVVAANRFLTTLPEGQARSQLGGALATAMDDSCGTGRLQQILDWLLHHTPPPPPPPWSEQFNTATMLRQAGAVMAEGEVRKTLMGAADKLVEPALRSLRETSRQFVELNPQPEPPGRAAS